jgi:hypothetical protein
MEHSILLISSNDIRGQKLPSVNSIVLTWSRSEADILALRVEASPGPQAGDQ